MADNFNFLINDCALISIATGQKAMPLAELRNNLTLVSLDCVYHHFWGGLLVPRFEEREFNNDFAGWVRYSLQDPVLAERLAAIGREGEELCPGEFSPDPAPERAPDLAGRTAVRVAISH